MRWSRLSRAIRSIHSRRAPTSTGRACFDVWGGPYLEADSLMVPYSVSKNTIGLSIGLLVERGQLDLDARVADSWPEFAAHGKEAVTVRQLLSHQAGLPQTSPPLTSAELLDDHAAAARLADSWPYWHPGSAFGYHGITIGNLGAELVYRATGRTLHEFYETSCGRRSAWTCSSASRPRGTATSCPSGR